MSVKMAQIEPALQPTLLDVDNVRREKLDRAIAELIDNDDLDRLVSLVRLVGSAQDAMSDDIVARLAGITVEGIDLLDRVNRSGVARALPTISALIENGDLDRIVALARLIGSAQDALSDDVVSRLAGITTESIDLLDRVNRSGVARALPSLSALIENGDFDRIVALARLLGSAQDALSDDIVARLAGMGSDALGLLDRATRNGLAGRVLTLAEDAEKSGLVPDLIAAVNQASKDVKAAPRPQGGLKGLWQLLRQQEVQETLQFALGIVRALYKARSKSA